MYYNIAAGKLRLNSLTFQFFSGSIEITFKTVKYITYKNIISYVWNLECMVFYKSNT